MKTKDKIAIKGHAKHHNLVILYLEHLGGKNNMAFHGDDTSSYYSINPSGNIVTTIECPLGYTETDIKDLDIFVYGNKKAFDNFKIFLKYTQGSYDENRLFYKYHSDTTIISTKASTQIGNVINKYYFNATEYFANYNVLPCSISDYHNNYKKDDYDLSCELELLKFLIKIRDIYNGEWSADWRDDLQTKYCICATRYELKIIKSDNTNYVMNFKDENIARRFLIAFGDDLKNIKHLL